MSMARVSFEDRAWIRLGIIRNASYIPQWDLLPEYIEPDSFIVLYGAGEYARICAAILDSLGVSVGAFISKNPGEEDVQLSGRSIPVISLADYHKHGGNKVVGVAVSNPVFYGEVMDTLQRENIRPCDVVGYYVIEGYRKLWGALDEELSKLQLLDSMKYLVSYSRFFQHYFDKRILAALTDHEVFLDAGCFDGQIILDFVRHSKGKYRHIYGFEANQAVFEKYQQVFSGLQNATIENIGLWSGDTELQFAVGDESGSSFLTEYYDKSYSMPVTALDNYFSSHKQEDWPTFIKMDLEGADLEALRGAKKIIKAKHPKLALSVYHLTEHFWQIPELIKSYDSSYTFFLRHYSPDDFREFVLYAV
ncbi:FkbM family methyltransferase [Desulfitobacterium hafniense]|nr:FkbM family methyltransferase [Desulfitobacterium hafniense]